MHRIFVKQIYAPANHAFLPQNKTDDSFLIFSLIILATSRETGFFSNEKELQVNVAYRVRAIAVAISSLIIL